MVVSFSAGSVYRSIFYMKMDFTDEGATDIATLRDDTCDGNPRAGGCSVFAGPSDPSDLVGVSDENGNFPPTSGGVATTSGVPEMVLSPTSGGSGSSSSDADAYPTREMVLGDFDNDGNMDVLYGVDSNDAARVTLARPYDKTDPNAITKTTSVTNENDLSTLDSDTVNALTNIETIKI